jgi:hypothetical protein
MLIRLLRRLRLLRLLMLGLLTGGLHHETRDRRAAQATIPLNQTFAYDATAKSPSALVKM